MFNISGFLKKIQSTRLRDVSKREVVVVAIKRYANIDIPINSVDIKTGVVVITGISPAIRSAIYTKKVSVVGYINSTGVIPTVISDIK